MDTGEQVSLNPRPLPPRTIGLSAVVAIAVSALLAAWGTFGDEDSSTGDYVFVLVIIGVLAAIVYGFVVPRAARGIWPMARTGLILSIPRAARGDRLLERRAADLRVRRPAPRLLRARAGALGACHRAILLGVMALIADVAIYIADQTS
jgi:hypothetical protein